MNKIGITLILLGIISTVYNSIILYRNRNKPSNGDNVITEASYTNIVLSVGIGVTGVIMIISDNNDTYSYGDKFAFG